MIDVFVTRRIPAPGLELLDAAGLSYRIGQEDEERPLERDALLAGVGGCRILLSLLTEAVDGEVLAAGADLRGVANMAVGYNNIDVAAASARGLPVSNTPGVLTETTADLTWALILAVARQIPQADAYMRAGRYRLWGPNLFLGSEVGPGPLGERRTLGIVGYGRIGAAVARRAKGFGMRVLAYNPRHPDRIAADGARVEGVQRLEDLLEQSDYVSLHVPLKPETTHLIDAAALARMRPSAFLINTSRGPVVDEVALVDALRDRRIAGAGLDVYEEEPAMAPGLAALDNVVILPHVASATAATRGLMATMAAQNAIAMHRGERAPHVVNPEVYR